MGSRPRVWIERGEMMVQGERRTQPEGEEAAVRRTSRAVVVGGERGWAMGTSATRVAMSDIRVGTAAAVAPMAPPGW